MKILKVKYLNEYKLEVLFSNGYQLKISNLLESL